MGTNISAFRFLDGNLKERDNLGQFGINMDNVTMDLKETGWEGVD